MRKQIEGSMAVAEAVRLCRAQVISAYPITPQTHIVEFLAQMVANGELQAEFVNVESEFSAASVCLGAVAAGVRAYTATTSQGLLLMAEVLYNIAGMRLPMVLTCANRALSAPISIWNDHQDAMTLRDSGWIQLWVEDNQETLDAHLQAFKIAQMTDLPVMVNMDGFVLTHSFDPVDIPTQKEVDRFLPPYTPSRYLDPAKPLTFGALVEPDKYMETRYTLARAMEKAETVVQSVADEFYSSFGRYAGGLVDEYRLEDAQIAIVAMGSVVGTIKDAIDEMRDDGQKVGLLKIRTFRPFPKEAVRRALRDVPDIAVIDRALSVGSGGIIATEVKEALYGWVLHPRISSFIAGLGGRDITIDTIRLIVDKTTSHIYTAGFADLHTELIREEQR